MNDRQRKFVDAYLMTSNAAESARIAGYSARSSKYIGDQLMRKTEIKETITRRLEEVKTERTAEIQETLEFVTAVMRGEMKEIVVVNIGQGRGLTKAEKVEVPTPIKDRLKAAEFLLKVNGAFKAETKILGAIPVVISGADKLED